jgi:hypothetical protein
MSANFLEESIAVLTRTPAILDALLRNLPEAWAGSTEGPGSWSAYQILGHLIHGEETDWMPRVAIILEHGLSRTFEPFDSDGYRGEGGKSLPALLDEFAALRSHNIARLRDLRLTPDQLELRGTHPEFGPVTLRQHLAAWTAHDLSHIIQIARVMARRYKDEVGPWLRYLSVMK